MPRMKKTARHETSTVPPPPIDELYPRSEWFDMKSNNPRLSIHSYKCQHPIILSIINNHPWRDLFTAHHRVPQVYLQQLWGTMTFQPADPTKEVDESLLCSLGSCSLELDADILRVALNLPNYESFDPIPEDNDVIMQDILTIGYTGSSDSLTLDWDKIPPMWQFLLQLMCHCLTPKSTAQDYATRRTLLYWTAFALDKKYDIARLIYDELKELVIKKVQAQQKIAKKKAKAAKAKSSKAKSSQESLEEVSDKKGYIPFQRFLQLVIACALSNSTKNELPPRYGEDKYPIYETRSFRKRHNAITSLGMPIPETLLALVPVNNPELLAYRNLLASTSQSQPIDSTPEAIAPTHGEGLDLDEGKDVQHDSSDSSDDEGGDGKSMRVQTPVHTPAILVASPPGTAILVASPPGIHEGGVEKMVSEGERKKSGDKRKRTPSDARARHRGTTSSTLRRSSTEGIEQVVVSPTTQPVVTSPLHSLSPLGSVSKRTGQSPSFLTSTHLGHEVIEKESQQPRLSTSFGHLSSPIVTSRSLASPIALRDDSGTDIGRSQSERFRGLSGSPTTVTITPAVNVGSSSGVFVPSPGVTTSNLRDLGLPKHLIDLSKVPIPGKGKGVEDPVMQLQYHLDQIDAQEATLSDIPLQVSPLPPKAPTPSKPTILLSPLKKSSQHSKSTSSTPASTVFPPVTTVTSSSQRPSTIQDSSSVKSFLKTLPRDLLEEVLVDMCLDANPKTLRDATIIDAICLPRDYVPSSHKEILDCQHQEMLTMLTKYRAYAETCRSQAELKRRHSDDDDTDDHPNEGEIGRIKRVKLEKAAESSQPGESGKEKQSGGQDDPHDEEMDYPNVDEDIPSVYLSSDEEVSKDPYKYAKHAEVIDRIRKSRVYDLVNKHKREPKPRWEDRLTVQMTKEVADDLFEKRNEKLERSEEHLKLHPLAKTKEFDIPQEVKLVDPEVWFNPEDWHKRINTPFVEDKVIHFYRSREKVVDVGMYYGLTKKDKKIWKNYKLFRVTNRIGASVFSIHGIAKVKKIDTDYYKGIEFPTFVVTRRDGKDYSFTEADFDDLNTEDIFWLFNSMKRWEIKRRKDRFAEECLKRFVEGQVKKATLGDFQIALESGAKRVNLTKPNRNFPIAQYNLWSIVHFVGHGHGIIYTSPFWEGNLILLFNEVHKYSTGTLRLVLKEIEAIIEKGNQSHGKSSVWIEQRSRYEEGRTEIMKCIEYRRLIQRYEMLLNSRENIYSTYAMIKSQRRFELNKEQEECTKLYPQHDDTMQDTEAQTEKI